MQNVLACIDANRACDRGGCLMGHRDKAMYSSCFKLPFEGGRPPRGEPRPEFGPGSFLTGRGRKIGRCAELRGSETRSHARVQEENISANRFSGPPLSETEHFRKCPPCAGYVNRRDRVWPAQHQQPLPDPPQDRAQLRASAFVRAEASSVLQRHRVSKRTSIAPV
jgi:hypothetical protein